MNDLQNDLKWHRDRLGMFTASEVYKLMQCGKGNNTFSGTALSYIHKIHAQRKVPESIVNDDEAFGIYIKRTEATSKEMDWGKEFEPMAIAAFSKEVEKSIEKSGFINMKSIKLGCSPDGIVEKTAKGKIISGLEVKCLSPENHNYIFYNIHYANDLKNWSYSGGKGKFYYQCMASMMVTGANLWYFMSFDPMNINDRKIVYVNKSKEEFDLIRDRLALAEEYIKQIEENNIHELPL